MKNNLRLLLAAATIVFGTAAPAAVLDFGEAPPAHTPAPGGTAAGSVVLEHLGETAASGRILFDSRVRYESAAQTHLVRGEALTLRTRIGYETARIHGFFGLAEFENNSTLASTNFAPYPGFNQGRTMIADGRTNRLNRLQAGFEGFNMDLTVGRQVIQLDNQRFVGPVGWRQNNQTFDALRLHTTAVEDLWISYAWNWRVNRVFGSRAPAANLRRFSADNHFVNVHYRGLDAGTIGAYFYFLDLAHAPAVSGTTAGGFFDGTREVEENGRTFTYRAEFALQTDNRATGAVGFTEYYYRAAAGMKEQRYSLELNFETLTGNGMRAFQTPLATLHAFQGWNDVFLTTPRSGLRDYSIAATVDLPWSVKSRLVVHHFTSASNSQTYGNEAGASFGRSFGENVDALAKGAYYIGSAGAPFGLSANRTKLWLQLDFRL